MRPRVLSPIIALTIAAALVAPAQLIIWDKEKGIEDLGTTLEGLFSHCRHCIYFGVQDRIQTNRVA